MTYHAAQQDLSREDVEALPDSDVRTLLLVGFETLRAAADDGFDNLSPLPLQFLDLPDRDDNPTAAPMVIHGAAGGSPSGILEFLASAIEHPETRPIFVLPVPGAIFRAAGIFYRGWVAPPDHPKTDNRDPGDIPGAVPTRLVAIATIDGVALTIRREQGREPLARLTPLLDTDDGLDAALHTAAGREADLLRKLRRTALALRQAYAEGVSSHTMVVEDADDHVCGHDHGHDDAEFGGLPSAVVRGDHPQLSREDLEGMPSSPLRDLTLIAMDLEAHYEQTVPWGNEMGITYRHCVGADGQPAMSVGVLPPEEAATPQQLHMLAEAVRHDVELRSRLTLSEDRYVGVSLLTEGRWFAPTSEEWDEIAAAGIHAQLPQGAVEGRLVIGLARDGGAFTIRRSRGGEPIVVLVEDFDDAAVAFGGDIMAALRELNAAYSQFDSTSIIVPEPNAAVSDLPQECLDKDYPFATIAYRWQSGTPREGQIYPALPSDHPFAELPCWCGDQLADGLPVQAYICDPDEGSGGWQTSNALILHQRCIPQAAAVFANTMSDLAESDHDHND